MSSIADGIVDSPERFSLFNPEVFFAPDDLLFATRRDLDFLIGRAAENPRGRIRLCAHPAIEAPLHEMLIVHHRSVYAVPHRHIDKAESFHIIDGEALMMLFDDGGSLLNVVDMGAPGSGKPFYYRIPAQVWHGLLIRSEWLVFHEVTEGPFVAAQNVAAPFAADPFGGAQQIRAYTDELETRVKQFFAQSEAP